MLKRTAEALTDARSDMNLAAALPAVGASFLASLVEVVEAFTIVLAVATVRGTLGGQALRATLPAP